MQQARRLRDTGENLHRLHDFLDGLIEETIVNCQVLEDKDLVCHFYPLTLLISWLNANTSYIVQFRKSFTRS